MLPTLLPPLEYWQRRGQNIWPLKFLRNCLPPTPQTYQPPNLVATWVQEHGSVSSSKNLITEALSLQSALDCAASLSSATRSRSREPWHLVSKPREEIQVSVPSNAHAGYLRAIEEEAIELPAPASPNSGYLGAIKEDAFRPPVPFNLNVGDQDAAEEETHQPPVPSNLNVGYWEHVIEEEAFQPPVLSNLDAGYLGAAKLLHGTSEPLENSSMSYCTPPSDEDL